MPALPISPLAPTTIPTLPTINGVRLAGYAAGLRYQNRPDLLAVVFDKPATTAGVFTLSTTASPAVEWCRALRKQQATAKALIVNAGNANVFNGAAGTQTVQTLVNQVAKTVGCEAEQVWHSSTGVIGEPLDPEAILDKLDTAFANACTDNWQDAAMAIRTTDTFSKLSTVTLPNGVIINGIAKGSGMVAPNMATMLGYVFTNAAVDHPTLQACLQRVNEQSFNAITVDSDTSTSDTVLAFAIGEKQVDLANFEQGLLQVCQDLAHQIIRDGEGATKFISITVQGAANDADAKTIAMSIANSPLVKTAIAGEDANWGRVVMAMGKTGIPMDRHKINISFGVIPICVNGGPVAGYDEAPVAEHLRGQEVSIEVDLQQGNGQFTAYTCDLTHGYIDINADYRS